jgi:formylglycine-generating enzyme required for sulfatase activity
MTAPPLQPLGPAPAKDVIWMPGSDFLMGSDDFYPEEHPAHQATVGGFWMEADLSPMLPFAAL